MLGGESDGLAAGIDELRAELLSWSLDSGHESHPKTSTCRLPHASSVGFAPAARQGTEQPLPAAAVTVTALLGCRGIASV